MSASKSDTRDGPDVACIMALWENDNEEFASRAIESVLSQTKEAHLYLGVDGPVGEALQILIEQFRECRNVNVVQFDQRRGLASVLNDLIDIALADPRVEYIARMDADDISRPERFERQTRYLERNPKIDLVGACAKKIDDRGDEIGRYTRLLDHCAIKRNAIWKSPFIHPTVVFRRHVLEDGWRYDKNQSVGQDYHLWVRLLAKGYTFSNLPDDLLLYRMGRAFYSKRSWKRIRNDIKLRLFGMKVLKDFRIGNWFALLALVLVRTAPRLNRLIR